MGKMKDLAIQKMNDEKFGHTDRCRAHESGLHEPDLTTVHRDHQAPPGVVDLTCVHCGRSGSVLILSDEVDW